MVGSMLLRMACLSAAFWADPRGRSNDKSGPGLLADFRFPGAHGGARELWDGLSNKSAGCAKISPGDQVFGPFVGTSCLWCRPQQDKNVDEHLRPPKVSPVGAVFVLDVSGCFRILIGRSLILCRSGTCSGLPGDLVHGPWGSIPGPGRGFRGIRGPPQALHKYRFL